MIGRITNQMSSQMTLTGIESALDRLDTTQQELSTGKSINQPSDNPAGTALALQLNTDLSNLTSYSNNVTDATGWSTAQSSALTDMTNAVQRVRELTVEAANGTQTTADMQASAQEVNQLIDEVKQDANAQYNGQYVFAGSATSTEPYPSGSDAYAGNSGTVTRTIGPSTTLTISQNLEGVLGNGQSANDGGLLDTLRTIASDMQSGNSSAVSTDLSSLDTNLNQLNGMSASVGAIQDRLQMASSRIQTLQTSDTQVLSNTQDADMASTEISFSTQQAALTAALQAGANIVQESLMNFLGTSSG
jgi:flagellar hook-associated protein 3 FlgL